MANLLSYFLPAYFVAYFGIAFVLKSVLVARRIGKSPLVFPDRDSAYGLIGFYFKLLLLAIFGYVMLYAVFTEWHPNFLPIFLPAAGELRYLGLILLAVSLLWTIWAQVNMKDSWRIGIDHDTKTALITKGLFSISRNPVFFGMLLSLAGLFLVTPNALTLLFLIVGYILIQIQIRLEEDFLQQQHGDLYQNYKQRVRRLI